MDRRTLASEIKVGIFVLLGVLLLAAAILALGGGRTLFTRTVTYETHYRSVSGLIPGARVMLSGVHAGSVRDVTFDPKARDIRVELEINAEISRWVRADSEAELATQGMLGDRYVSITAGSPAAPPLPPGSSIRGAERGDLGTILSRGDELMVSLTRITGSLDRLLQQLERENRTEALMGSLGRTAVNLAEITRKLNRSLRGEELQATLRHLENILAKIDGGQGSLGAFINDPSLYDDTKAVVGEVNRNRVVRNLVRQAVRGSRERLEHEQGGSAAPPGSR